MTNVVIVILTNNQDNKETDKHEQTNRLTDKYTDKTRDRRAIILKTVDMYLTYDIYNPSGFSKYLHCAVIVSLKI